MGILQSPSDDTKTPTSSTKRKSLPTDFSKLGPLSKFGTVGFSGYRDSASKKPGKKRDSDDGMDSDGDSDDHATNRPDVEEDVNGKDSNGKLLSAEDANRQERLAEGVGRIKVCTPCPYDLISFANAR
jgi:hypothetical protein